MVSEPLQFLVGKHLNSTVKNICFSDHDATKIHIQEEIHQGIDFAIS